MARADNARVTWDPVKYYQFSSERNQPFFDLVSRVNAEAPRHVVDLGCGPGDLTAALARRWPTAMVTGLDSSDSMIATAQAQADLPANVEFVLADVSDWQPEADVDVMVSNALLQWVPHHTELIAQWADALAADGWLAFQVPGNFDAPSHTLLRGIASSPRWAAKLDGVLRPDRPVAEPAEYQDLLLDNGFTVQAWETTYFHQLTGPDPVLQWVRGTALRPVLSALSDSDAIEFETEYAAALRVSYPATSHGTLFPFRRIFCVGRKLA